MVIDTDGVYSPIAKHEVRTSYDGARTNPEDFDKWWNGSGASLSKAEAPQLFKKKAQRNAKFSQQTFEAKDKVVPAADQIIVKR
jgi:cephalosporin-C deacetylase-like acetyl esterase